MAALVAVAFGMLGCSGGDSLIPTTTTTTASTIEAASFDDKVCLIVGGYLEDLTAEVNRFQAESRDATGTDERRRLYLDAWDRVAQVNDELDAAIDGLDPSVEPHGEAVVDALTGALAANRAEAADGIREATDLPDEAYDRITVPDGSLFTGGEKMRSKVRFALAEVPAIDCV